MPNTVQSGVLDLLAQDIADALLADLFFADIPVVREKSAYEPGDEHYEDLLAQGMNDAGRVVGVQVPMPEFKYPDQLGVFADIPLSGIVKAFPHHPSGGPSAHLILAALYATLHTYKSSIVSKVVVVEKGGGDSKGMVEDDGFYNLRWHLKVGGALTKEVLVLPDLDIEVVGSGFPLTITLSCDTPGAVIFFTTNGKHPSPPVGTLYTAPFQITSAATLKARAWLPGYVASELLKQTYP